MRRRPAFLPISMLWERASRRGRAAVRLTKREWHKLRRASGRPERRQKADLGRVGGRRRTDADLA